MIVFNKVYREVPETGPLAPLAVCNAACPSSRIHLIIADVAVEAG